MVMIRRHSKNTKSCSIFINSQGNMNRAVLHEGATSNKQQGDRSTYTTRPMYTLHLRCASRPFSFRFECLPTVYTTVLYFVILQLRLQESFNALLCCFNSPGIPLPKLHKIGTLKSFQFQVQFIKRREHVPHTKGNVHTIVPF